jgi:hypothetical protein
MFDLIYIKINIIFASVYIFIISKIFQLPKLLLILDSKKHSKTLSDDEINKLIIFIDDVINFKMFVIRKNCYKKTLLLYYFLKKFNVKNIKLNIGINKKNSNLNGHSWITIDNNPVLDNHENIKKYNIIYSKE